MCCRLVLKGRQVLQRARMRAAPGKEDLDTLALSFWHFLKKILVIGFNVPSYLDLAEDLKETFISHITRKCITMSGQMLIVKSILIIHPNISA